jgi:carbonic anhydrase/acetyltransferase-like protein (isoleucine patch superfamily)
VETGERVILAHGSAVRGPARLGVGPEIEVPDGSGDETKDSGVFVSFGALVDGAVLERDSGLSVLSRVGPGIRLRSGFIVLPGKNVTTQRQADEPALGKVRPITEADREFNAAVVEVNVGLAREYSRLAADSLNNVRGLNVDPGGNKFDKARDLPTVESALCTGPEARDPDFRNRVIGDICFEDSMKRLGTVMGDQISLRADEGGPFAVGSIRRMDDGVIFHALEHNHLGVGSRVHYGKAVIVHGGGRPQTDPTTGLAAPTLVGNDVVLHDGSVVFRSLVRNGAVVGRRSAVVGSQLRVGQRIPDRTIYANDAVAGPVEW